ncbi:lymphatic vessel endothelial hyaluronic acid receptor 1-like isoform X1 [Polyodon spathula]|uniref:lymphatic vessel endothelial hyaluronic acid receptor 1-like isoform X1 n=1 Tax=Polyodon spathula TaxID=7913 RepID=UPI001B7E23E5|nr:lymphatic vessel endothelial hyaluronic acid receptor 1-like isoform X1 [Polyodon spathula]
MAKVWLILFLFFALVISVLLQNPINIKDLVFSRCRISGVLLVSLGKDYKFNATYAKFVCQSLGVNLATKDHIKKASEHGLETCRFGWIVENVAVVSRIKPLLSCGQNKTGVLEWRVPLEKLFDAYCFNSTDTMTNSCAPIMNTTAPSPTIKTELTEEKTSPTLKSPLATSTKLMVDPSAIPVTQSPRSQTTKAKSSSSPQATNALYSSPQATNAQSSSSLTTSTSGHTGPMDPNGNADTSVQSKAIRFGALSTALLVLCIVFFLTALTAGVCYFKQYMKTLPIVDGNQEKECIETELLKHNQVDENEQKQEQTEHQTENLKDNNGAKDISVTVPHETNAQD